MFNANCGTLDLRFDTLSIERPSAATTGGDEKLRFVKRYSWREATGQVLDGTFDEYWYDALGRRVLVRYNIHASIVNSKVSGPKIDANFSIVPDGNGGYRATGTRDGYPSVEAYHYRTDGTVQAILQQQEGKPRELWGCCDKKVP